MGIAKRSIRVATALDAAAVALVHVKSWQETYAGLMPTAVLSNLSVASRTAHWEHILRRPQAFDQAVVVVAQREGAVVSFGSCGKQRTLELCDQGFTAEISAIYVLQIAQRSGVGSALMAAMAKLLLERGHRAASLWVLRGNVAARHFYEWLGGEIVGQKQDCREDMTLAEVAYGWRDLDRLLARAQAGARTEFD